MSAKHSTGKRPERSQEEIRAKKLAYLRAYRQAHRQELLEAGRQRYWANREQNREAARKYYEASKERIKAKTKLWRELNHDRKLANGRAWNKANLDKLRQKLREFRRSKPERLKAYNAVNRAVRKGKLKRMPCELCGSVKSQAHHEDYSKPLEVRWLCAKCHKEVHDGKKTLPASPVVVTPRSKGRLGSNRSNRPR